MVKRYLSSTNYFSQWITVTCAMLWLKLRHHKSTYYICGATPKVKNDEFKKYVANRDKPWFWFIYCTCLDSLFWMFASYKLSILKNGSYEIWADKKNVKQRSVYTQNRFKTEIGLIVDKLKPGFENTSDKIPPVDFNIFTGINVTYKKVRHHTQNFGFRLRY